MADVIPDELQRIVEFLNTQMTPAEVFAVEVRQYASPGFAGRTIVPRVIGRTANSMTKQRSGKTLLSAEECRARAPPETRALGEELARWAHGLGLEVTETRQARTVLRSDRSVVARLYYDYDALDVDMTAVRERKGERQAAAILHQLQALTTKTLTDKWPSVPAGDFTQNWPAAIDIFNQLH